ncbi:phage tail assembly chaperone [Brevibacillus laterosporus]|uniref:Phage portal protein n=1 Tax=Brevibacillus laterosporus TaxID=1465 RepID=A0AAP3GBV1_BRELA|nr:hypothetical protein [Brevibacillus laterosporus]MCR8981572.1 hypothetical protein [Brevibacillus laterosporus]MCZ0808727.1 hypothetical protein [Brevibacillus laterosporus]MCZ0827300.1 hypothetical protein [Brevibacillus laterosporus]MCZ0851056.1 hypothetical protein [Brevibacillus laterosporus]
MSFQDFFMDEFEDAEVVERMVKLAGKEKKMQFKPISAAKGGELRKSCRKVTHHKGAKQVYTDHDAFVAKMIIETTVNPDFKNKELQDSWGVIGADNLLAAMKTKMSDGEYNQLAAVVSDINGYDEEVDEMAEEIKN